MKSIYIYLFLITAILYPLPAFTEDNSLRLSGNDLDHIIAENNLELQSLKGRINIAEAETITAGKINNPSLFYETESFTPANVINNNTQLNLGLSYEFLLGNQTGLKTDIANLNVEKAKLDFERGLREKLLKAKQGYNELLYSYKLVELKEIHLHHAEEIYDVLDKQYKAGDVARYEVYRAELDKSNAQKLLESAHRKVKIDTAFLNTLLNRPLNSEIIPIDKFVSPKTGKLILNDLITTALKNYPELKSIETGIRMEELKARLAEASVIQSLDTELALGNQGINARIGIPVPIFYRQEGEKAVSRETVNYLNMLHQSTKQAITAEVTKAYQQLLMSVEGLENFEKTVMKQSENIHILALKRLNAGEGGLMEVLEAEHTRHEHEDEFARLLLEANKNLNYLEYITGGTALEKI